jgi:hypothetical protein
MKHQDLRIGTSLKVEVVRYDKVPEPPREEILEGEVVGWRDSQLIVRITDYAVLRFWKKNGMEVGNRDYQRRGFRLDISSIAASSQPSRTAGIEVSFSEDGG